MFILTLTRIQQCLSYEIFSSISWNFLPSLPCLPQCNSKTLISFLCHYFTGYNTYRVTQKKQELLKTPTKIEEIQEKKCIDRNWIITACLLRDSNPNYKCLKITSCRWRPPPRMHSFTATTYFKSSPSFVSPCVFCMLCRMRHSTQHTQGDTKERELLKCVVAVKECIRGGGRHLQEVIFKHW